jgi:hypothetical protein
VVSHQGNVKSDQASEGKDVFNIKGIVSWDWELLQLVQKDRSEEFGVAGAHF